MDDEQPKLEVVGDPADNGEGKPDEEAKGFHLVIDEEVDCGANIPVAQTLGVPEGNQVPLPGPASWEWSEVRAPDGERITILSQFHTAGRTCTFWTDEGLERMGKQALARSKRRKPVVLEVAQSTPDQLGVPDAVREEARRRHK